jgi:hypothetical protein
MGLKYGCSSRNHWGLYSGHSPLCLGFHEATCQAREVKGIVGQYAVIWDAHVDSEIVLGLYLQIVSPWCCPPAEDVLHKFRAKQARVEN